MLLYIHQTGCPSKYHPQLYLFKAGKTGLPLRKIMIYVFFKNPVYKIEQEFSERPWRSDAIFFF